MIRIIKQGTIPTKKRIIYKHVCTRCGCVFEFETEDMLERAKTLDLLGKIECPFCHQLLDITKDNTSKREEEIIEDETTADN